MNKKKKKSIIIIINQLRNHDVTIYVPFFGLNDRYYIHHIHYNIYTSQFNLN